MNERIKELAEQNGFIHKWMPPGEQHDKLQSLEKFTQLIVQECIRYFNEDYNRNFATLWREDLSIGVKQHFGVKE